MTTTTFKLTEDQATAIVKLKEFCSYRDGKYFRLTGYAGTGKSFIICQLIRWLKDYNYSFLVASPTNKAAKNLKNMANDAGLIIDMTTVAKLLGQQAVLNEETGKEEFIAKKKDDENTPIYDVIIIDEFSMVNEDNFSDLCLKVEDLKTKIIFVGDAAQLPPVGEKEPIIANHPSIIRHANLSQVVRYDGELAKVAEEIRSNPIFNKVMYPFTTKSDRSIETLERYEWLERAVELFKSNEFKANPNYVRFLVWRNKTADKLNAYVRNAMYGENASIYQIGDRLIAKVPVFRSITVIDSKGQKKEEWKIAIRRSLPASLIASSEECQVIAETKITYDVTYGWQYYQVPVLTDDGVRIDLRILTDDGKREQKEYLQQLKQKRQWKAYYNALKSFDTVPYAYAITTHKSQGSSIDYAFVDTLDMKGCPDLQKMLYTALTRAKEQACLPTF
ncbi:MAG: ATP-dependent RecD-like DNA helicase [Xenococcaceae cyanobacterium]